MLEWWLDSLWLILPFMVLASTLLSLHAFFLLHRRQKIFIWDYGLVIYVTIFWTYLQSYAKPVFGQFTFIHLFVEGAILVFMCSVVQYIKLKIPDRIPAKYISILSILFMMLFTCIIFYLMPIFATNN